MKKFSFLSMLLVGFMLFSIQIVQADLNDGLVAYYPFNGNANDESGNGNDGTVHGAKLTTDRFGNSNSAYIFNGEVDYIDLGNNSSLTLPYEITISAWIQLSDSQPSDSGWAIVAKGWDGLVTPYTLWHLNNWWRMGSERYGFAFGSYQSVWHVSGSKIISGLANAYKWYHVVGINKNSQSSIYVDGVLISTESNTLQSNAVNTTIGAYYEGSILKYFFSGRIDDIRIYNRALSESEIQEIYSEGEVCEARYDEGYEAGKQYCIDNPEACGLKSIDDSACVEVITYGKVPNIDCWIMFSTPCDVPEGWEIVYEKPSNMCDTSSENSDNCSVFDIFSNTLHVPCFDGGSTMYWLDLELTGSDPVTLELKNLGTN